MENLSLCADHSTRIAVPKGCPTCWRINIERDIVTRVMGTLLEAGYWLKTDATMEDAAPSRDHAVLLRAMMEVDDEYLLAYRPDVDDIPPRVDDLPFGWVRFVYGNDGADVISDYTTNLEPELKPVLDYIEQTYE